MTRHTHIIGIAGAGMSAIAGLLLEQGDHVSGCDRVSNVATRSLIQRGAIIFSGHSAAHLDGIDRVLVTSALPATHPELVAAVAADIPVQTRHDLWREWSAVRPIVAIAGTHGKTTTTAMTALVLQHAGVPAGYLIGADVAALGGAAHWGEGPLVIEADEYAHTFLALAPQIAVITNIDWDHVDIYPTQAEYDAAFRQWVLTGRRSAADPLIVCGDDAGVQRVLADIPATRCGFDANNDWRAIDISADAEGMQFCVLHHGEAVGMVRLHVPGRHNVLNALLALAVADVYAIDVPTAAAGLATFGGAARRFEFKGTARDVLVFDDYAHHPTEIRATLAAARGRFPNRRLVVYFQPHTFSRLHAFSADFSTAFAAADVVRIGDVYAAREQDAGADLATQLVGTMQHPDARAVGDLTGAFADLRDTMRPGDVLVTLGAGDGVQVGEWLITGEPA